MRFVRLMRALVAAFAYEALVATGWTLDAHDAWRKIEGRKVSCLCPPRARARRVGPPLT